MENGWMINLTETPLDGHTPDLTITPIGRRQYDIRSRILEGVIGRSQFFQPEASFLAGIPQLIM